MGAAGPPTSVDSADLEQLAVYPPLLLLVQGDLNPWRVDLDSGIANETDTLFLRAGHLFEFINELYLGRAPTVRVDFARLDRVTARITRGLYWHHFGERLPSDWDVAAWSESAIAASNMAPETVEQVKSLATRLLGQEEHALARDVLRYWNGTTEVRYATLWLFEFYRDVRFLAVTAPMSGVGVPPT